MSTALDLAPVLDIAREVFTAMVDDDPDQLAVWTGPVPDEGALLTAWVDVAGPWAGRVQLSAGTATVVALAHALLAEPDDADSDPADVADAFGELANVIAGNVKSLHPSGAQLGLPQVADVPPPTPANWRADLPLAWRGHVFTVSVLMWAGANDDAGGTR